MKTEQVLQDLESLVGEELKAISYKWLSRQYSLPSNVSKQLLFSFAEQHRGTVAATYLLAGWTREGSKQHVVQLVKDSKLATQRASLEPITSMHIYSVQPAQPKDPAELWNAEVEQTSELLAEVLKGRTINCMADNRWSSIRCVEAKFDPALTHTRKAQTSKQVVTAGQPEAATAGPTVSAIKHTITGGTVRGQGSGNHPGNTKTSVLVSQQGGTATTQGPAPQPTLHATPRKPNSGMLADMWSKAPQPVKPRAEQTAAPPAQPAADPMQQASEGAADSEDECGFAQPARRRQRLRVVQDDSPAKLQGGSSSPTSKRQDGSADQGAGDENIQSTVPLAAPAVEQAKMRKPAAAKKAAAKPKPKAAVKKAAAVEESRTTVPLPGTQAVNGDANPERDDAPPLDGPAPAVSSGPKHGSMKRARSGNGKRRRVMRSSYNDKGEEVVEWVVEESGEPDSDGEGAAGPGPTSKPASAPGSPQVASKPAAVPAPTAKADAKKAAKSSAAGQRGIMSFFAKK